jgi:hypothetical protein
MEEAMETTFGAAMTALGLALAVGLHTTLPLLIFAALQRGGWAEYPPTFAALNQPVTLPVLGVATLFESTIGRHRRFPLGGLRLQLLLAAGAGAIVAGTQWDRFSPAGGLLICVVGGVLAATVRCGRYALARGMAYLGPFAALFGLLCDGCALAIAGGAILAPSLLTVALAVFALIGGILAAMAIALGLRFARGGVGALVGTAFDLVARLLLRLGGAQRQESTAVLPVVTPADLPTAVLANHDPVAARAEAGSSQGQSWLASAQQGWDIGEGTTLVPSAPGWTPDGDAGSASATRDTAPLPPTAVALFSGPASDGQGRWTTG